MDFGSAPVLRNVLTVARRGLGPSVIAIACVLTAACASGPQASIHPSATPDQVLATLTASRATFGDLTDGTYGLHSLRLRFQPLAQRCQADGGVLAASDRALVVSDNKIEASSTRQHFLPTRLMCRSRTGPVWAASLSYGTPNYIIGVITGSAIYSAQIRATFVSSDVLVQAEAARTAMQTQSEDLRRACAIQREAYSRRVKASPQVGMQVAYGMIVELRAPLALVQYDSLGKALKHVDQEWVPIASLGAGTDCPS